MNQTLGFADITYTPTQTLEFDPMLILSDQDVYSDAVSVSPDGIPQALNQGDPLKPKFPWALALIAIGAYIYST